LPSRGSAAFIGGLVQNPLTHVRGPLRGGAVTPKGSGRVLEGTLGEGGMDPKDGSHPSAARVSGPC
jgi:hypothetical protein